MHSEVALAHQSARLAETGLTIGDRLALRGHAPRPTDSAIGLPQALLDVAVSWRVPSARNLLESGFSSDVCYYVLSGAVRLACGDGNLGVKVVDVLGRGEWAGLECIQTGSVAFSAETLCESTLLVVRRGFLQSLFEQDTEIRRLLMTAMTHRYRSMGKRVTDLTTLDADQRVCRAVELLALKFAPASCTERRLPFPLTQSDIADIAGTTRQSANRAISRMKNDDALAMIGRNYVLRSRLPLGA